MPSISIFSVYVQYLWLGLQTKKLSGIKAKTKAISCLQRFKMEELKVFAVSPASVEIKMD